LEVKVELQIVPTRWDDVVMTMLWQVFFQRYSYDEFSEKMRVDLEFDANSLVASSEIQRATDIFYIRTENSVVAFLVLKFYKWTLLGPQLFFEVVDSDDEVTAFRLKRFNELVTSGGTNAGELAYFWVDPALRGQGVGRLLFDYAVNFFQSLLTPLDVAFTLAQGNKAHLAIGIELRDAIIEFEKQANGVSEETGLPVITSRPFPVCRVEDVLGFPTGEIDTTLGARATKSLALKRGMNFRGYSRNLSLLFASTVSELS